MLDCARADLPSATRWSPSVRFALRSSLAAADRATSAGPAVAAGRRMTAGRARRPAAFAVVVEGIRDAVPSLIGVRRARRPCAHCVQATALARRGSRRPGSGSPRAGPGQRRAPASRWRDGSLLGLTTLWSMATTAQSVSDICLAARTRRRARSPRSTAHAQGPRAARDRRRARARGRPRSSRPTRATWRRAARPGSTTRCSTACALDDGARRRRSPTACAQIAALPDPVGEVIDGRRLPNGLDVRKVRVPLGVVAVVYEARPNVTIDAAALCLKSGNAIVLRGSSSAAHSNAVLAGDRRARPRRRPGCPRARSSLVAGGGREELAELATQEGVVDLIIPRGGEGLKAALKGVATVPVIYAASGNCHVYVDASADLDDAERDHRSTPRRSGPGVCNAAETLLVHADVAAEFLPARARARCARPASSCASTRARARWPARRSAGALADATDEDWDTEFLALILAVGVVDSVDEAIEHINAPRLRALRGDRHRATRRRRARSSAASTPPASTSTRRRASPTAASSAWAPRSATRRRSCTPAGRSACASCAPSSTWSTATATCGPDGRPRGARRDPRRHVQPAAHRPSRLRAGGARPARARPRRC